MRPPAVRDRIAAALIERAPKPTLEKGKRTSPGERDELRERCGRAIYEGMRRLGVPDPSLLEDENGFLHFPQGTIQCTLGMVALDDGDLFLVYAPIMDLPSDRDLILPLYRLLLELNNQFELSTAKFGLHGATVFLSAMRPLVGLDAVEVMEMVRWVSRLADDMDERLLREFGGTSKRRGVSSNQ